MAADFVAGDTTVLKVVCRDNETHEIIPDLDSAASVELKYRIADGELQTRTMHIVDPAGLVSYQFEEDELTAGIFRGEVTITDAGNNPLTNLEPVVLTVRKRV
jgi:hypothetical protein